MLHVLPAGAAFDLTTRTLVRQRRRRGPPEEAAELAVAGRDLRQMARDIAAGDVSPSLRRRRPHAAADQTDARPRRRPVA